MNSSSTEFVKYWYRFSRNFDVFYRKEAEFEALQEQFESTRAQELAATRLEHENERSDLVGMIFEWIGKQNRVLRNYNLFSFSQTQITTHEDEVKRLKKQLDQLGTRMSSLDAEYSSQTDDARFSLFEAPPLESDAEVQTCEGNIRQRYRQEVEHLRVNKSYLSFLYA